MNKPVAKKTLRAKYLTAGGDKPIPPPAEETPAAPEEKTTQMLYELKSYGQTVWHTLCDAAICLASETDFGLGGQVKDAPDARPRQMTAEEKQKLFDLSASFNPH